MKHSFLQMLACPHSGQPLTLVGEERQGDEIVAGLLAAGSRKYPIIDGVPCFLDRDQQIAAKQGFTPMWRYRQNGKFERNNLYGIKPERKAEWVASRFHDPVQPGEWVLDAGCGSAETTHSFAAQHSDANVVGLDFSDAVRRAAHGAESLPNLHFVQADIAHPPFPPASFRRVFSLGVLHHTPDTWQALAGASRLLAPGAELLMWLYPAYGESLMTDQLYFMRDLHFLGAGHKLRPDLRLKAARVYSLAMMPAMTAAYGLYKTLSKFSGPSPDKVLSEDMSLKDLYDTAAFAVYDNISPEHQHRHSKSQVLGWLRELGFCDVATDGRGTFTGRMAPPSGNR
jgi:SAM-dependent methyltransferase